MIFKISSEKIEEFIEEQQLDIIQMVTGGVLGIALSFQKDQMSSHGNHYLNRIGRVSKWKIIKVLLAKCCKE